MDYSNASHLYRYVLIQLCIVIVILSRAFTTEMIKTSLILRRPVVNEIILLKGKYPFALQHGMHKSQQKT